MPDVVMTDSSLVPNARKYLDDQTPSKYRESPKGLCMTGAGNVGLGKSKATDRRNIMKLSCCLRSDDWREFRRWQP